MSVLTDTADLSLKYVSHYNDVKEQLFAGSSDIINKQRNKAFQDFISQGIPTRKNENYKYTNLNPAFTPDFEFVHEYEKSDADLNEIFRCDVPRLDTYLTLVFNGWFYKGNKRNISLPGKVIIDGLENAAKNYPEMVQKYYSVLADTESDPLVALNTAFARDGYFLLRS